MHFILGAVLILLCKLPFVSSTCYTTTTSDKPRNVLSIIQFPPEQTSQTACESACTDNSECMAIAFTTKCVLLGTELTDSCPDPSPIFIKQENGCPQRSNITAEMGTDPCVIQLFPDLFQLSQSPFCPKDNNYVIRAVTEDGDRITLDNDPTNVITFDPTKNLWHFSYTTNPEYKNVWIVAASCATADGSKCPCSPMPMNYPQQPGDTPALTETDGACATDDLQLRAQHGSLPDSAWSDVFDIPTRISIRCRAGLWVFHWRDSDGWSLKNASCIIKI